MPVRAGIEQEWPEYMLAGAVFHSMFVSRCSVSFGNVVVVGLVWPTVVQGYCRHVQTHLVAARTVWDKVRAMRLHIFDVMDLFDVLLLFVSK